MLNKLLKLAIPICFIALFFVFAPKALAAGCAGTGSCYWVGGTGNWSDTTKWATASGGATTGSVPTSADDVYFDANSGAGTATVNVAANTLNLDFTGYTGTFAGGSSLYVSGNAVLAAGMTWTHNATLAFSGAGTKTLTTNALSISSNVGTFTAGMTLQLVDNLTITGPNRGIYAAAGTVDGVTNSVTVTLAPTSTGGSGQVGAAGTTSLYNLTITGPAAKTHILLIGGSVSVSNILTINGNSAVNRVLINSNTKGTARTITAANVSVSNADFQDITGAGAGSWDLSGATGGSGDAGGNTGITFTTAATQYWVGDTGSWSTAAEWGTTSGGSGGRVPLPQDDVVFDNNSFSTTGFTVTQDMPRAGRSIDWSALTDADNPTFNFNTSNVSMFGNLTLASGMTISGTGYMLFEGRGSHTITTAGNTYTMNLYIYSISGTYTLQDSFISNAIFIFRYGTFNANNFNLTAKYFDSNQNAGTRTINMGSGTWTATYSGLIWDFHANTNINAETSTIKVVDTSATAKTFNGGGKTYNNLWFSGGAGGGSYTFTGSNTFADFKDDGTAAHSILFTAGTETTVSNFTVSGTAGNLITIGSVTAASHTLTKAGGGTICSDYLSISRSTATPADTWYAGANSTDGENNSGWSFTSCVTGKPRRITI